MADDFLALHAQANPDGTAVLVDEALGGRPSATPFAELNRTVNRLSHALRTLGVHQGERIVWSGPNSLEVITTIHAARKAGQVAVPVSYRFNADEMAYVIDNSDATLVITDAEQAPRIASIRDRIPKVGHVVVFGGDVPDGCRAWDDVLADEPDTEPVAPDKSEVGAQMLYTSGTTGKPKGALRTSTDAAIVAALLAELGFRFGQEVHITTGPLYHSGPLAFASIAHTMGSAIVVLRKFDPSAWLRLVKEHRATNTFSAPTQLKRIVSLPPGELAEADLSSMRCLIANAAPVPYALKKEVFEKLGDWFLYEVYGSTELGIVTVMQPKNQMRKPGSCGHTYGGIEVRIVTEDGSEAPVGDPGELFIRTRLAMDGYHRTDEKLSEIEEGGWKSVGDVAYVDDDGFLFICDRLKDMIISGGVNIYPAEIEAVIHEHGQVMDAAVFGVPDEEWGESVYCVVQEKPGETLDLEELDRFVTDRVAGYKRPRGYELRAELPRTDAGKLLKRILRNEFWADRQSAV
ncbi:MAG TPA: AMP-binding protein [Acidimicrobiia bacterium]|nr:AMP-binding protein [Acidimicrobiia bacterium]